MKKSTKLVWGIALAAAAAGLIVYAFRSRRHGQRLSKISNEGYETADDVLFPREFKKGRKQHYGPVLPQ